MQVTESDLLRIYPYAKRRVPTFAEPLNRAMANAGITTPKDVAMFLAQVGHESGQLRYTEEIASGAAYEGRKDLGNVVPGDGVRFKGRGLIQVTGRDNYAALSFSTYGDHRLLVDPTPVAQPELACVSACWFWNWKKLWQFSDDIVACTRIINGGQNGIEDRKALWSAAKKVLGVVP